ncbi:ABC transporter permease [Bosea sp. 2YAB26]|uniref:ABC transporter permease n=1 Tax=Bosea sp. 2YAB26 TaxID=3237478 RepID=UPI003F92A8ED
MMSFVLRRLWQAVPTILAATFIIFFVLNVLPGSVGMLSDGEAREVDPVVAERMRVELGLDQPMPVRYGRYIGGLLQGDMGTSFKSREPVSKMVGDRIWPSLKLAFAGMGFALLFGVPVGFMAALRQGTWLDGLSMVGAVSGVSMPQFWLGLLLMYVGAVVLRILPPFGYGDGATVNLILPALTLGFGYMALLARSTRAAVIEILNADYVRTARAKGMSELKLNGKHVAPNAMVLVLTTASLQFGSLLGHTVVVEKLFAWPGIGSLLVDSVFQRDLPVIQGCVVLIVVFFLIVNLGTDILYSRIDPRIRLT